MPRRNCIRRCLLAVVATWLLAQTANAQIDCAFKTLHVSGLHGNVTDQFGNAIAGAEVTLKRDGQEVAKAQTDDKGRFDVKGLSGRYGMTITAKGFASAWSPVEIGPDMHNLLHSNLLRAMLFVGAWENCETFTTSKRMFDRAVQFNHQRYKVSEENNATQK